MPAFTRSATARAHHGVAMSRPQPANQRLRLLSCNILAGASVRSYRDYVTHSLNAVLPGRRKIDNLDHLAALLPQFDVIGLQEADAGSLRSGFLNQTRYLAEAAGMPYWSYQSNRPVAKVSHTANGLISRIEPSAVLDYPLPGHGRGALLVRFGEGKRAFAVVIAHLSLRAQTRAHQLGFISEILADYPQAVLMGDLNTSADSAVMRQLFARSNLQPPALDAPTFPSWKPRRALDHILVSPAVKLEKVWTLPQAFSDHLALAAEIRLPAGRTEPSR
jgi:endonuclease/exonuclease/phosphatase family metal-dependent hydrolase